jgi:hypothetical protein
MTNVKKNTLRLILFISLFSDGSSAQTLLSESFDISGEIIPPNGWTYSPGVNASNPAIWDIRGATTGPVASPHSGIGMAVFNSYTAVSGDSASITSPALNFNRTGGVHRVKFWMYRLTGYTDFLDVMVNTNSSSSGATLLSRIYQDYHLSPVGVQGWSQFVLNIPSNFSGAANYIVFKGKSDGGYNIYLDDVEVEFLPNCQGAPDMPVLPTGLSVCRGNSVNISPTGGTNAVGISYQWQQAPLPNSATWTNIVGATGFQLNTGSLSSPTSYRLQTTCANTGLTSVSLPTSIGITSPAYASLPYSQDFESWSSVCVPAPFGSDAPGANWVGVPASGNNAWRREDQGGSAGWTTGLGFFTPAFSTGSHAARFHTFDAGMGTKGSLDLYINLNSAGSKLMSFDYINPDGTDSLRVLYSSDGGLSFSQLDTTLRISTTWSRHTIQFAGLSATGVIRFEAGVAARGYSDIGLDNLLILPGCSGTPTAGVNPPNLILCLGTSALLAPTGVPVGGGIGYQWETTSDTLSNVWMAIAGATNPSFMTPPTAAAAKYRLKVTCSTNGSFAVGNPIFIRLNQPTYSNIPYSQDFESWITQCGVGSVTLDAPDVNWLNRPYTGEAAWRRDDQGTTAQWTSTNGTFAPRFTRGAHAARFHSYFAADGAKGVMDVYLNLGNAGIPQLSFDYINFDGDDSLRVLYSTNGGTGFTQLGATQQLSPTWTTKRFTLPANLNQVIIRLEATSDFGDTDIGIDNFVVIPQCTGQPSAGVLPTAIATCPNNGASLNPTGVTLAAGITYQWQQSANGTTSWTAASGTNNLSYYPIPSSINTTTYFRLNLSCINNGLSTTGSPVTVGVTLPQVAILPVIESFENWISQCATSDVPGLSWANTPINSDSSWRREIDGISASWRSPNAGAYPVGASQGLHSARFHSYYALLNTRGNLDLRVDLSGSGIKRLGFDYVNRTGTDSLRVLVSTDNGLTFVPIDTSLKVADVWSSKTFNIPQSAANAIVRLEASSDYGDDDIGIDNLRLCKQILAANTLTNKVLVCPNSRFSLSLSNPNSGASYQWQSSTDSTTWSNITGATNALLDTSQNTQRYYRCRMACVDTVFAQAVKVGLNAVPLASISPSSPITLCTGDTARLTASGGSSTLWNTGIGLATLSTTTAGTYTATVSNAIGCSATASSIVQISPRASALFTNSISGGVVVFNNTNSLAGTTYIWTFGDGSANGTIQNPSHTFSSNGSYIIKLVTTTANGCRDSSAQTITLTRVGTADIAAELGVKIFPNPVKDVLTIERFQINITNPIPLIISNILGEEMGRWQLLGNKIEINTNGWATGVYIVQALVNGKLEVLSKVEKM